MEQACYHSCGVLQVDIKARLAARIEVSPADFTKFISRLEMRFGARSFHPEGAIADLLPGTFYLDHIDDQCRRKYCRKA